MKTLTKNTFAILGSLALMVVILFTSCEEEEDFGQPQLPPANAFVIDFTDFETNAAKDGNDINTSVNFAYSALQVGFWRAIISVGLAVPVASYQYALQQTPTKVELNKWLWTYNITVNQDVYIAELYGTVTRDSVFWEMYISKTAGVNQFSDYKWYTGAMNFTVTDGYWILNDNPISNKETLRIDWSRTTDNQTWDIRYMNVIQGDPENGGFIHHGNTTNTPFEAFFTIFNKGQNQTTNIEWDRTTVAGRVKASHFFSDSNWHCWDEMQQDVDCSN